MQDHMRIAADAVRRVNGLISANAKVICYRAGILMIAKQTRYAVNKQFVLIGSRHPFENLPHTEQSGVGLMQVLRRDNTEATLQT